MATLHTDHGTHGLVLVGADFDGQNGYVRGITNTPDGYLAITGTQSKHYKTLRGAIRFMADRGYDPHGWSGAA